MIAIHSERVIIDNSVRSSWVGIENGKIVYVGDNKPKSEKVYDFEDKYVSPGFIDLHTHGAGGYDFLKEDEDGILSGTRFQLAHGATTVLPTISAAPFPDMCKALKNISKAMKSKACKPNILGVHMEGPYLSKAQCGAQCTDYITPPHPDDYINLVKEYGSVITRWTYAPEEDKDGTFCKYLSENGIIPSAGHTNATEEDMKTAIKNGCSLITHMFCCTSTITRNKGFRSLGVIESAYLHDELYIEIIADGKHLPSDLIKMVVKIKGTDKTALVTDSLHIACTDIKEGYMSGTPFIVEDGVCKLRDRSAFAGSVATMDKLVKVVTKECGFSVTDAVKMACTTPAEILKIKKGSIKEGYDADLVVFDEDIDVSDVFVMGEKIENLEKERKTN